MERIGGAENRAERRWVCHRSSTAFSLQLTAWRSSLLPQGHARLKALSTDAGAQHRKMQSNRTARLTAARKGILRVVPSVASAAEFDHVVRGGRAARRGVAVAVVRPMRLAAQHPRVLRVPTPRDRPWPAEARVPHPGDPLRLLACRSRKGLPSSGTPARASRACTCTSTPRSRRSVTEPSGSRPACTDQTTALRPVYRGRAAGRNPEGRPRPPARGPRPRARPPRPPASTAASPPVAAARPPSRPPVLPPLRRSSALLTSTRRPSSSPSPLRLAAAGRHPRNPEGGARAAGSSGGVAAVLYS